MEAFQISINTSKEKIAYKPSDPNATKEWRSCAVNTFSEPSSCRPTEPVIKEILACRAISGINIYSMRKPCPRRGESRRL